MAEEDTNRHPWKRAAWESREAIREAMVAIPNAYPRSRSLHVSDEHELLHKFILEYHSAFRPYREKLIGDDEPGLWDEPIATVTVPTSGHVNVGSGDGAELLEDRASDREVIHSFWAHLPTTEMTVSLDTLVDDWARETQITLRFTGWVRHSGEVERTISATRYLPLSAAIAVRDQLDDALESFGWLPEMSSTPRTEITNELIEEIEEWRQGVLDDLDEQEVDEWLQARRAES